MQATDQSLARSFVASGCFLDSPAEIVQVFHDSFPQIFCLLCDRIDLSGHLVRWAAEALARHSIIIKMICKLRVWPKIGKYILARLPQLLELGREGHGLLVGTRANSQIFAYKLDEHSYYSPQIVGHCSGEWQLKVNADILLDANYIRAEMKKLRAALCGERLEVVRFFLELKLRH